MRVLDVRHIARADLLTAVRGTRLRGFGGARPYQRAHLELVAAVDPDTLAPAQNYVLRPGLDTVRHLRSALLTFGVDPFALDGAVMIRTEEQPTEQIPVLPPIVEESYEPGGRLVLIINDGLHRVYAARAAGVPISVVIARGVPAEYPYYAYALPGGWADVAQLAELPDGHQKKAYRQPDNYKALFREFNAVFPGVQRQRRQSNPAHLRA